MLLHSGLNEGAQLRRSNAIERPHEVKNGGAHRRTAPLLCIKGGVKECLLSRTESWPGCEP
jgi:hypothetical protein